MPRPRMRGGTHTPNAHAQRATDGQYVSVDHPSSRRKSRDTDTTDAETSPSAEQKAMAILYTHR
jgi:hypothetical protein